MLLFWILFLPCVTVIPLINRHHKITDQGFQSGEGLDCSVFYKPWRTDTCVPTILPKVTTWPTTQLLIIKAALKLAHFVILVHDLPGHQRSCGSWVSKMCCTLQGLIQWDASVSVTSCSHCWQLSSFCQCPLLLPSAHVHFQEGETSVSAHSREHTCVTNYH